jgi:hypothetical protein
MTYHAKIYSVLFLVWWSRRNENSDKDCDIELNYENPSLEAKICGKKEKQKKNFINLKYVFRLLFCQMSATIWCLLVGTNDRDVR